MAVSRKKKIIIGVVAGVVLAIIVVVSVIATRKEEPEVITVNLNVRPELKQTVTASGEVRPVRYIKLTSEVPGRIEEIYVTAGDMVTKGKPLVRVDPTQLQTSQEAQWAATQASINDVQNARRSRGLSGSGETASGSVPDFSGPRAGRTEHCPARAQTSHRSHRSRRFVAV